MFEVGKYYYNNSVLVKVESVDADGNVKFEGYNNAFSSELIELMGYYELPIADPDSLPEHLKIRKKSVQ